MIDNNRQLADMQIDRSKEAQNAIEGDKIDMTLKAVSSLMQMFDSEERPRVFLRLFCNSSNKKSFWPALHWHWPGFDHIPQQDFAILFRQHREAWSIDHMETDNRNAYDALPERFTVYRGQDFESPAGLSWTLSRDAAESFAIGHRRIFNPFPVVITATVRKDRVAGVYLERNESEVALINSRCATNRKFGLIAAKAAEAA